MASRREVQELLGERPDLEPAIEAVLEPEPPWEFEDVPVDSGAFGELVNAGVVEKMDGGYRVADPTETQRGLTNDRTPSGSPGLSLPDISFQVDRTRLIFLTAAVMTVVLFRLVPFESVYYRGHVVLTGNDAYFYRYWVEQLLADSATQLGTLPGGVLKGEPLLVVTLWAASGLLGGTSGAAGTVLAWYPVVTAALTATLVYLIALTVTDDRRIALASVLMLAVLPGHALRTGLGFGDHHAFDYLWLTLTVFGLSILARHAPVARSSRELNRPTIGGIALVALGVTAQTLAWDNSPLLLGALGLYLVLESVRSVYAGQSPLPTAGPATGGLGVAAGLVWLVHSQLGWHTELVATAPVLVFVGGIATIGLGVAVHRFDLPATALAVGAVGLAVVMAVLLRTLRPDFWTRLLTSIDERLLAPRPIAEVQTIFSDTFGWLLLFGILLVLAVPYLAWAGYTTLNDGRWLPLTVYSWYFLILAGIQARFVGELSPFIAVFAGFGFVHLAERIDVARRPAPFSGEPSIDVVIPDLNRIGYLAALFLLVAGLSIIQVPVLTSLVTPTEERVDTAIYLDGQSAERGLEYPRNYVLSEWSWNRLYNYFVNGRSSSYGFARSNYGEFLVSTQPGRWYDRLNGRVGFIVVTDFDELSSTQLGATLYRANGSRTDNQSGLGHYRLVYVSETGRFKVFELVPGAIVAGEASPNTTVALRTEVRVPGLTFTYVREATTDASGAYQVRVAHPGTYEVSGERVRVTANQVWNGSRVTA